MLPKHVELIQSEDQQHPDMASESVTPIFLIHDGGGTTYAYHCLAAMKRLTYGIGNPHFFSGERFQGGLAEMGSLYTSWVRQCVTSPSFPKHRGQDGRINIFLGGWSLGGLLSLEMAKLLADDDNVRVAGILMIDSIYPAALKRVVDGKETNRVPSEDGLGKNQVLSQRCMKEAIRMVDEWQSRMPRWEGPLAGKRPRAMLLRATQPVPRELQTIEGLDDYRDDETLGWKSYDANMLDAVMAVEGHHLDLFTFARVEATTAVITRALEKLDALAAKSRRRQRWRNSVRGCWHPGNS